LAANHRPIGFAKLYESVYGVLNQLFKSFASEKALVVLIDKKLEFVFFG
jgi:hypothetical protein